MNKTGILKRYAELEDEVTPHLLISIGSAFVKNPETGQEFELGKDVMLNWLVKAQNLIANTCGEDSQHFKKFDRTGNELGSELGLKTIRKLLAIFLAAKDDFEKGYIFNVRDMVQAEVFSSELDQASELLQYNYTSAAAVIAGTVLETRIRSLCDRLSIPQGKLDKMNADLVKKNAYNTIVQKKITALASIRNSAAHGKNDEFTRADVESMINDIKNFICTHELSNI